MNAGTVQFGCAEVTSWAGGSPGSISCIVEQENLSLAALAEVARQAGMSTFYFCKMFRKATGLSFTQYLSRSRVEKAKTLLLNRNYRVSEIACEVGFQSLTHFNRTFKRIAGESPTNYRQHPPTA